MKRWWAIGSWCIGMLWAESRIHACEPAVVAPGGEELPSPWRDALRELVDATLDPTQPWGCPGGTLTLVLDEDGALLEAHPADRAPLQRRITVPAELVPMGKAMLARPLPPAEPREPAPSAKPPPQAPPSDAQAPMQRDQDWKPRAHVEAAATARYIGVSDLLALGGAGRGALAFQRWSVGLFLRYTLMVGELGGPTPDFDFSELAVGGGPAYALVTTPVRFTVGLYGAMAVVDMEAELMNAAEEVEVQSGAVDGRIGTALAVSIPLGSVFHLPIALDADLSPASLVDADRRLDPALPPMPGYTVGLSMGLEVVVP